MRQFFSVSNGTVLALAGGLVLLYPLDASAHANPEGGGLIAGFLHPLLGPDHLAAMVAVGLWGAFLGRPALIVLPILFPLIMALGGMLGIAAVPVPQVETGIALSAVVLGLAIATAFRPPLWTSVTLVGLFALLHGHAHGTEIPQSASAFAYSFGFIVATGLLHLLGIALGAFAATASGRIAVRGAGAVIAGAGMYYLLV